MSIRYNINFKAMILFIIVLQIVLTNTSFNKTDQSLFYLNACKARRLPRCHMNNFLGKTSSVFSRTERFSDNKSDFITSDSHVNYNVLKGLLLDDNVGKIHWDEFKTVYKKRYCSKKHEISAFDKWKKNLERVAKHNRRYLAGLYSYSLDLNHFGDLASEDYFKKILKLIETPLLFDPAEDHHKTAFRKKSRCKIPREVDWRKKGFKPRREEQSQCGACYAFAVTHALQAQLYKAHMEWTELSPQQIVDCSFVDGNNGCDGGSLRGALRYVAREGLVVETSYPYKGKQGKCHDKQHQTRTKPRRWAMLPSRDERAMEKALATIGPLAVAVNAVPFTFQLYKSGIYDDPFCTPWQLNHAMLLVGYTPQYWILLNWWGRNWGEDGYMRIRRGLNRCGVANMAAYVEL